jgi:hypothetical protein
MSVPPANIIDHDGRKDDAPAAGAPKNADIDTIMKRVPIQFVETPKIPLPIKHVMNNFLATWPDISAPSVLQVAAHLDEFIASYPEFVIPLSQKMPFADLLKHPEKVEAALKTVENGNKSAVKPASRKSILGGRETKTSGRSVEKKNP